jgi:hypothetical protein
MGKDYVDLESLQDPLKHMKLTLEMVCAFHGYQPVDDEGMRYSNLAKEHVTQTTGEGGERKFINTCLADCFQDLRGLMNEKSYMEDLYGDGVLDEADEDDDE